MYRRRYNSQLAVATCIQSPSTEPHTDKRPTYNRMSPTLYSVDTRWFPGVKQLGHGVNHSPPSGIKVKERVELHHYFPSLPSWQVIGWSYFLPSLFVSGLKQARSAMTVCVAVQRTIDRNEVTTLKWWRWCTAVWSNIWHLFTVSAVVPSDLDEVPVANRSSWRLYGAVILFL